jgi:hypothetical protein
MLSPRQSRGRQAEAHMSVSKPPHGQHGASRFMPTHLLADKHRMGTQRVD